MRHSDPSTFKTHIQVIIGITTFLILSSPNLFSKSSPTYSPSYKYSSLNLNHLAGPVEKLIYDESSVTFDKNGNIIQEKDKYVELNYTYNKKGYTIHNQHGGFEGEWYVTIDELHRKRIDKRVDGQSRASYTYTFDDKGRLISTVFEEKGRKVISSIHYPNEQAFKPDSSWHTTYYSGYMDDVTVRAYWYNKLDRRSNWLEVQLEDDKAKYYSAYYDIRQVGYFDEPLISRSEIAQMKELIHGPCGERISTKNNKSGRLALIDKKYEPTEYELNFTKIHNDDADVDVDLQEESEEKHPTGSHSVTIIAMILLIWLLALFLIIKCSKRRF